MSDYRTVDLVKARRAACASPHICFEFGDNVSCQPCETIGAAILKERERCLKLIEPYCNSSSLARILFDAIEGVQE